MISYVAIELPRSWFGRLFQASVPKDSKGSTVGLEHMQKKEEIILSILARESPPYTRFDLDFRRSRLKIRRANEEFK